MNQILVALKSFDYKKHLNNIIIALCFLFGGAFLLVWANQEVYKPLFLDLNNKENAEIITFLDTNKIDYKLDGSIILVPQSKVSKTRIQLAGAGLPKGQKSLIDPPKFGSSPNQEALYKQQLLEQEIIKSLLAIQGVNSAQIHIGLQTQSYLFKNAPEPSASVLIDGDINPNSKEAKSIQKFILTSVPGLKKEFLSVVNQQGVSLIDDQPIDTNMLPIQQQQQLQNQIYIKLNRLLDGLVGKNNYQIEVDLQTQPINEEEVSETFKPNSGIQAIRSQNLEESTATPNGGVPGTTSNTPPSSLPPLPPIPNANTTPNQATNVIPAPSIPSDTKKLSTTNFELDRTVKKVIKNTPKVEKIKIAVAINYKSTKDKNGLPIKQAPAQAELDNIQKLVEQAAGLDTQRGDSIQVLSFAFAQPSESPSMSFYQTPLVIENIPVILKLLSLLIGAGLMVMVLKRIQAISLAWSEQQKAIQPPQPVNNTTAATENNNINDLKVDDIKSMTMQNPKIVANVIKEVMES